MRALERAITHRAVRRPAWLLALTIGACSGGADPGRQGGAGAAGVAMLAGGQGGAGAAGGAGMGGSSGASGNAGSGGGAEPEPELEGSWLPLATGNTWTYQTSSAGVAETKVQTIGDWGPVGGTGPNSAMEAFAVVTQKNGGADMTESWQAEVDGKIVRYRERSFSASTGELELEEHWAPFKLRLDGTPAHVMLNATWTEQYMETKLAVGMEPTTASSSDTWRIVAVGETITVPAGTFKALLVEKTGGTSTKRYWFVRGVGKVKETGTQVEELVSYEVQP